MRTLRKRPAWSSESKEESVVGIVSMCCRLIGRLVVDDIITRKSSQLTYSWIIRSLRVKEDYRTDANLEKL